MKKIYCFLALFLSGSFLEKSFCEISEKEQSIIIEALLESEEDSKKESKKEEIKKIIEAINNNSEEAQEVLLKIIENAKLDDGEKIRLKAIVEKIQTNKKIKKLNFNHTETSKKQIIQKHPKQHLVGELSTKNQQYSEKNKTTEKLLEIEAMTGIIHHNSEKKIKIIKQLESNQNENSIKKIHSQLLNINDGLITSIGELQEIMNSLDMDNEKLIENKEILDKIVNNIKLIVKNLFIINSILETIEQSQNISLYKPIPRLDLALRKNPPTPQEILQRRQIMAQEEERFENKKKNLITQKGQMELITIQKNIALELMEKFMKIMKKITELRQ